MPRPPPPARANTYRIPAPTGGLNTAASGLTIPPTDCVQAYNLVPAENGLRSRLGSSEWVTGINDEDGLPAPTRSEHAFVGSGTSALFVTTDRGMWQASVSSEEPDLLFEWPTQGGNAGYGVSTNITTVGGHFLVYCDEVNGTYIYSELGNLWAKVAAGAGPTQIDGADPADFAFCMVFKSRLWFVERGTSSAWYMPIGQIYGTATEFPMGVKMRHGGALVGLWDWTYDGGSGADDSLVVLSTAGDVLVWQGTDPDDALSWGLRGVWYVGKPPAGRLVASDFGGDLVLLTRQGVIPMSRLVVGIPDARAESLTSKIANLFNTFMGSRADERGWAISQHPEDNTLVITIPAGGEATSYQLVQSVASKGWFLYRGLDMRCMAEWEGQLFFGTSDGRVLKNTGYVDGILLADVTAFTPVDWALISAFSDLGSPGQKQVQMLRPLIRTDGAPPSVSLNARYQYDTTELGAVDLALATTGSVWDVAVWDADVWGGATLPSAPVRGATGMGSAVAVAIRGTAIARTVLVGIEVVYTSGGFL